MGLWTTLIERLAGPLIDDRVALKLREALPAGLLGEDAGWRRVTRTRFEADALVQEISLAQVHALYTKNPLAKWILEMTRDLITAEGVRVEAKSDKVNEILQAFWDHDLNLMDINLPNMVLELGLWGEQCWPAFLPESGTGILSLGLVPSDMIKTVVHDPGNCALPIGIVLKDSSGQDGAKLKIIYNKPDAELFTARVQDLRAHEYVDGSTFWFKINSVRESTRGLSDLFTLSDWLDGYEDLLFNVRDRDGDLRAFAWDVTLKGMDTQQINAWLSQTEKPKPGSWFAHNENIELKAVTPDLSAMDTTLHARIYRNHIVGAMSYPEHWFGGAGDVNRSTANEAHLPTFKRYTARQRYVRYMIEHVIEYQLRAAAEGGMISGDEVKDYKVVMPQMITEDLTKIASALQQLTASAAQAVDLGWITPDAAQKLYTSLAGRFGAEISTDPDAALGKAQETPDYRGDLRPAESFNGDMRAIEDWR